MKRRVRNLTGFFLTLCTGSAAANTTIGGGTAAPPADQVIAIAADSPGCAADVGSTGFGAIAMGCGTKVEVTDPTNYAMGNGYHGGIVLGSGSLSSGANTVVVGHDAKAHGDNGITVGPGSEAGVAGLANANAIALGRIAKAAAPNSTAIGFNAQAGGPQALAAGANASATGTDATAIGSGAQASGNNSVALGRTAIATLDGAIAIGDSSNANAGSAIAVGRISRATATNAIAVGVDSEAAIHAAAMGASALANASNATAIGAAANATGVRAGAFATYANAAGQDSLAAGYRATASADRAVALGAGSRAVHANSVALGAGAATAVGARTGYTAYALAAPQSSAGEISVGNTGAERQITNVAPGVSPTDAINVSQLNEVARNTADSLGGGASYDAATGAYTGPTYSVGGQSYNTVGNALTALDQVKGGLVRQQGQDGPITVAAHTGGTTIDMAGTAGNRRVTGVADGAAANDAATVGQMNQGMSRLKGRIDKVGNRANAGAAAAMAMANLPQAYLPRKSMLSLGGAAWNGESGYALGVSRVSDNGSWVFKLSGATSSRGDYGGAVGVGYQW